MKKFLKFIKSNLPWMIVIVILLVLLGRTNIRTINYRKEVKAVNDSITVLHRENAIVDEQLLESSELLKLAEDEKRVYEDSLRNERLNIVTIKKRYEKAIADINSIPTDTLYLELTRWLDQR